jgi:hypothetical protein
MASTPEGRVKADIKKELTARGFQPAGGKEPEAMTGWYYMPVSNGMGTHGIPDFVCCWKGLFFGIEAKAPKGEPSLQQLRRHTEIKNAGGLILVVDDVSRLKQFFDEYELDVSRHH